MRWPILQYLLLIPTLILMTACSEPPPAEESCNFVQNVFNRRVSWARTPVVFYVDKNSFIGPDEELYYNAIVEAAEVWNKAVGREVLFIKGRTDLLPDPKPNAAGRIIPDAFNGIYRVKKEVFENTNSRDEQARTSISYRGDFIYEADIVIDASERFYFEDEDRAAGDGLVQFKSLMIHEFGHALGLAHIDDFSAGSVMYPKLSFGQMRPQPQPNGLKTASGEDQTEILLPEVDAASMSCEY